MTETTNLDALDKEISGYCTLLIQHQQNLHKLQQDKAIFAAGEEPLRLNNQIVEETRRVGEVKAQLKDLFYRKLFQLVTCANLSVEEISFLYRKCRSSTFVKQLPLPESSARLVELLWQMRDIDDNETPTLELIERLIRIRHATWVEPHLRSWQSEAITLGLLTIHPAAIAQLEERMNSAEELNKDSALLVEIALDPGTSDYLVRMYYWEDGAVAACWHKQENDASGHYNRTYKLSEIPNLLYRVLSEHEEKPTSIEFLLPKELLVEAVDQWVSDDDPVRFCSEHRIVIRSQERIAVRGLSKWRQRWREKWDGFQTFRDERDIYWVEPLGAHELPTFTERLLRTKAKAACLGFTFLPVHRANEQEQTSLLRHILSAGVPIMAWSRNYTGVEATPEKARLELESVLCKEYLDDLPAIVHDLRRCLEALDSAEHIGNRLALFWDDPDRIPDVYK